MKLDLLTLVRIGKLVPVKKILHLLDDYEL